MMRHDDLADLYATYALAVDGGDLGLLEACFARDAVYEVAGQYRTEGASQIVAKIASRRRDGWTHVTSNLLVSPRGSSVVGRATFVVLDELAVPVATGEYDDLLIKEADGSVLFARRTIHYRGQRVRLREKK